MPEFDILGFMQNEIYYESEWNHYFFIWLELFTPVGGGGGGAAVVTMTLFKN